MILYLVKDIKKKTYSHPMVAPDLQTVQLSFRELNPENAKDLKLIVLCSLKSISDLEKLTLKTRGPRPRSISLFPPSAPAPVSRPRLKSKKSPLPTPTLERGAGGTHR